MKLSYRQTTEMSGYAGLAVRERIFSRIISEFYAQPDVKAGTVLAVLLGALYMLVVVVTSLLLPLGPANVPFYLVGIVGTTFLVALSVPTKKLYVFISGRMDKEYEL